ncbi:MAG: hypothetical protein J1F20_03105 [Muribaculaceae bacterium]|nr:hypothetical protein [Muribaculaceae bacterium]
MRKLIKLIFICLNIIVACGLICSAFSSLLNPASFPRLVIASMSLPVWVFAALCLVLLDFFVLRKWCIVMAVNVGITLPACFTVLPLNIPRFTAPPCEDGLSWSLLSYNISNFIDLTEKYDGDVNPGISYILSTNADVVVIPEGNMLNFSPYLHIGQSQLDSLSNLYPYIIRGNDLLLLSKFPATPIHLDNFPHHYLFGNGKRSRVAAYLLNINGVETALFGCHLQSLGLTQDDKNLYEEFTRGEGFTSKEELRTAKNDIIAKIGEANVERAIAVDALISSIDSVGISNAVVCGDFNDTPCCYALRRLQNIGFHEVYPLVGNGYMFTYNSDRLLFQIDHVLFRGEFFPWTMRRGSQRNSDHYPLLTTFILEED